MKCEPGQHDIIPYNHRDFYCIICSSRLSWEAGVKKWMTAEAQVERLRGELRYVVEQLTEDFDDHPHFVLERLKNALKE